MYNFKKTLITSLFFFAFGVSAVDSISENDRQQKQQQQKSINDMIRDQQQRNLSSSSFGTPKTSVESSQIRDKSWFVKSIDVDQQGENQGPEVKDIISRYENLRLTKIAMLSMVRDITNRYAERGFPTTLMALDFNQLSVGILRVKVLWGRVSHVTLNGKKPESWRDRLLINSVLPGVAGNVLKLDAIDQAVDNLNNGILTAKVDIRPDKREGYSIINITTGEQYFSASLTIDNSGSGDDKSGRWKKTLGLGINGPLGNGDKINLTYSQNYYQDNNNNYYRSLGAGWFFPCGSWAFSLNGNLSFYRQQIPGFIRNYKSDGHSSDWTGMLSKVLSRSSAQKTLAQISVNYKSYDNYLEDQKIIVSSRNYSELRLGLNRVQSMGPGTLYGDASMNFGVPWFYAQPGLMTDGNYQRSRRLTGNLSWTQLLMMNMRPINWATRVGWQYSPDELPSAKKISIGDEYTVKGFSSSASARGDTGIWLSTSISSTFQPFSFPVYLAPFIGFEYGWVQEYYSTHQQSRLASTSAGLRLNTRAFFSSLTMGYPLFDSRVNKESEPVFWFSAGLQY